MPMHKSKPIQIIKNFSAWEMKELERFLKSPFFNSNEVILKLFGLLKKDHPDFESAWLEKEKLYYKVFDDKEYDESKLRYLFSDLAKLIEEYIQIRELRKNPVQQKLFLLDYYMKTDLEKYFMQIFDETAKTRSKQQIRDAQYYFHEYLLEEKAYNYSQRQKSRSIDTNLQAMVNNLDLFYISTKLKHSGEMLTREMLLKITYKKPLLKEVTELLSGHTYDEHISVLIYYHVVMMHEQPDDPAHYRDLLDLLEKHRASFTSEEIVDLYVFAQNYCTNRINSGDLGYLREIFDLYKRMISMDAIYEMGYVRPNVFKNIVTVGLRLEEYDWTESFIEDHRQKLEPKHMESAVNYNMAWLHFARKEYKKALRLLSSIEFMDIFYILGAKCLLLKTYYELEETDAFYSLTESFYVYLRRNTQIADYQKQSHMNFIRSIKTLMKLRLERDRKGASKFLEELESAKVLDLNWFRKKVAEI
jgi:hypothetical protein